jgi:hypothetical protein
MFEADETASLRAAGVRECFDVLTPIEEIAARLRSLGAEAAAARG